MSPYTSQNLGALLGCLVCLLPFVAGWLLSALYTRRRMSSSSWFEALLPEWLVRKIRGY